MSSVQGDKQQILKEFRQQVEEEGIICDGDTVGTDDDTLLCRFLRARKFDIKNAKSMLAKCQTWRQTVEGVGLDALYDEIDPFDYPQREVIFKYWPLWFHKTDKEGRPLNVQILGELDLNALYKHVEPQHHWRAFLTTAEALTREVLPACSRATGNKVVAAHCIVDLKGFGLSQFWQMKGLVRESFQISQDYYPETMGRLAVVNAPSSFTYIWSIVKRWLSPETVSKVEILGSDYTDYLLQFIDAENLPAVLGGKCTCEGLGGCGFSSAGPWLDKRVYKGHGPSRYRVPDGDNNVQVNAGEAKGDVDGVTLLNGANEETKAGSAAEGESVAESEPRPDGVNGLA